MYTYKCPGCRSYRQKPILSHFASCSHVLKIDNARYFHTAHIIPEWKWKTSETARSWESNEQLCIEYAQDQITKLKHFAGEKPCKILAASEWPGPRGGPRLFRGRTKLISQVHVQTGRSPLPNCKRSFVYEMCSTLSTQCEYTQP